MMCYRVCLTCNGESDIKHIEDQFIKYGMKHKLEKFDVNVVFFIVKSDLTIAEFRRLDVGICDVIDVQPASDFE